MTFKIFVNLIGINGFATRIMTLVLDLRVHAGYWEDNEDYLEVMEMKCVNGCLSLRAS